MKKILLLTSIVLTLSIIAIVTFNNMDNKENNIISNIDKNKQVINSNMITMMYETEPGSGEYAETKDTTWPESGYIFNENLSGCENGGELEYNSENNTVNLLSNSSDRCYVYFDKYDGVWIDNVSVTNVTGSSVTLDVSATSENGSITNYYYSLNDSEYASSTTNPITINDLNKLTEYNIKVYATDNTGAKSNIYEIIVSTTDESGPIITNITASNVTINSITLNVETLSSNGIKRYYYSIDNGNSYILSYNNSYTFEDLNSSTEYKFLIYVVDNNRKESAEYEFIQSTSTIPTFAEYIKILYTNDGVNGLYFHDGIGTYTNAGQEAGDNSYRYSGANPNNYVCFGSDAAICPSDNLYRIVGVFDDKVKLIKNDYTISSLLGTNGDYNSSTYSSYWGGSSVYKGSINLTDVSIYYWNKSGINSWADSDLNNINLNNNYLNNIGNWSQMISLNTWIVGGGNSLSFYQTNIKNVYNSEFINPASDLTYDAKVGLMYASDYGYAASPNYWTTNLSNYSNACTNNWMCMGLYEWTLTRISLYSEYALYINGSGSISMTGVGGVTAVRPTFYLNADVLYASGDGSQSNPFRIEV